MKVKRLNFAPDITEKKFGTAERLKITTIYILMLAGGLWHVLNLLQNTMQLMASVAMASVSLWLIYEIRNFQKDKTVFRNSLYWIAIVFFTSLVIEIIGVQTGKIFGTYSYGGTLKPLIGRVPVAIGFAWINMLLSSAAVTFLILANKLRDRPVLSVFVIALLMVIFDVVMEPAAGKLDYWNWANGKIPIQNYIAWFIIAFGFASIGMRMRVFRDGIPQIISHAYFAQLGYFFLVNLK